MTNWLKRLLDIFQTDVKSTYREDNFEESVEKKYPETKAKVAYHYPKGNFRFPLIPDQVGENNEPKPIQQQSSSKRVRQESRRKAKVTPIRQGHVQAKTKFKPTHVPSPIYGFQPQPSNQNQEEQMDESTDYPDRIATSSEEIITENQFDYNEREDLENPLQEETLNFDDEWYEHDDQDNVIEEVLEPSDELIEDLVDLEPQVNIESDKNLEDSNVTQTEQNTIRETDVEDTTSKKEDSQENDRKVDQASKQVQKKPTAPLPYNVLMLKRDKEKINERSRNLSMRSNTIATSNEEIMKEQNRNVPVASSVIPPYHLLADPPVKSDDHDNWLYEQRELLHTTLENFNVGARVVHATQGPSVTRFEVQPDPGVKVNKITNLADDLKLSLAAKDIRIEAPIPGKNAIGIEVPNQKSQSVFIAEILNHPQFKNSKSPLTVSLGLDIGGNPIVTDIKKMPHGLIAGATGSGKSVCINSIIISLLYKAEPHEVKLLLIDPKMVELAPYNQIPHLVSPVITDVKAATAALKWAVGEMERRYELFAHTGVRDIERYNEKVSSYDEKMEKMSYLVIIIDELADLMMVSPQEVEEAICRIAQKARACGIHLLLATQRPSVDVITGLIKANVPTRIAFSVSSQVDSRTIVDMSGAEKLLGKGDMLFLENGSPKPVRIQGNFVSDEEIERVTAFVKNKMEPNYLFEQEELIQNNYEYNEEDDLFEEACEFVFEQDAASASSLQRRFHIGYNRAARLIDMMEARGIISETKGSKPRDVLMSKETFMSK